jgi:hypothetical protein
MQAVVDKYLIKDGEMNSYEKLKSIHSFMKGYFRNYCPPKYGCVSLFLESTNIDKDSFAPHQKVWYKHIKEGFPCGNDKEIITLIKNYIFNWEQECDCYDNCISCEECECGDRECEECMDCYHGCECEMIPYERELDDETANVVLLVLKENMKDHASVLREIRAVVRIN